MKKFLELLKWTAPLILLCCSFTLSGQATQLNNFYGNSQNGGDICVSSENISPDEEVEKLVTLILQKFGVRSRYLVVPCDRTENCQAIVDDRGTAYILYNPNFLSRVRGLSFTNSSLPKYEQDWATLTILAHELGHHLNLHLTNPDPSLTNVELELEADETAGHILYKLGATLKESQRAMYSSSVPVNGSSTHPPRAQRLAAIEKGWRDAEREFPRTLPVEQPEPMNQDERVSNKYLQFDMVKVRGGTFTMGCTGEQGSDCYDWEKPAHQVTVSEFYIGRYEVTQREWRQVIGSDPPGLRFKGCDNCPVEGVSWEDIQQFLSKLNAMTGKTYRLPTEAEWEYAARGGALSRGYKYSGSNSLDAVAWHDGNSGDKTRPVGQKQANELGLYDMNGNVWEWCQDWYGPYAAGAQTNPKGPSRAANRIIRGGSWNSGARYCRNTYRNISNPPSFRSFNLGFRLVL
jgi:formylglycine-generating enzyme required for sulfatase activity